MKKLLKSLHAGQKGFTLIELLVVITILGVLAAIVVPNLAQFMGRGKVEAANTELANVQTALIAYMVNNPSYDGTSADVGTTLGTSYFLGGPLQATYTSTSGTVDGATAITPGKWEGLSFDGSKWVQP